jgi:membrane protein required for colicin V production
MLIDFTFAALLILAVFKGYQRGLILAVFSILAFIVGLAAALKLSAVVAAYLKDSVTVSSKWLPFIAFALVFFIVVVLVRLGARLIEKTIQVALLGWVNRIAGIMLYAALYIIVLSIFIFYTEKLQLLQPAGIQSSVTYPFIQPWGPKLMDRIGSLIPLFKDMFTQLGDFFNLLTNKIPH